MLANSWLSSSLHHSPSRAIRAVPVATVSAPSLCLACALSRTRRPSRSLPGVQKLLKSQITRHLTAKSKGRVDNVFDFFGKEELLTKMYTDPEYKGRPPGPCASPPAANALSFPPPVFSVLFSRTCLPHSRCHWHCLTTVNHVPPPPPPPPPPDGMGCRTAGQVLLAAKPHDREAVMVNRRCAFAATPCTVTSNRHGLPIVKPTA